MTRDEFDVGLDRYGGDLSRWPPTLRQQAEALTAADSRAAAALATAGRLDSLLSEVAASEAADAALIGRIVAGGRQTQRETVLKPTRRLAAWATAGVAATLMIGFIAGALIPADQSNDAIAGLMFSGTVDDISGDLL
jgi:hypothetical protein